MTNFMQDIESCQPIALKHIENWEQQNNGMRVLDYFEATLNQIGTISFKNKLCVYIYILYRVNAIS